jgi:uncharacterized protein (DUF1499 family)
LRPGALSFTEDHRQGRAAAVQTLFRRTRHEPALGSRRWADTPVGARALDALIAELPRPGRSRLAKLSLRLALFAVPVIAFAVLLVRAGRIALEPGLAAVAAGLVLALAALLTGLVAMVQMWNRGTLGFGAAIGGTLLGAALLAWPAWNGYLALSLPPLFDITTDTADPPAFTGLAAQRRPDENAAAYAGAEAAAAQQAAYPDIERLQFDLPPEDVYAAVTALLAERGWTVTDAGRQPDAAIRTATLQASDPGLVLGLPDDVVIRLRPDGSDGTLVDMRSASRVGRHDLGANAARIEAFLRDVSTKAGARAPTAD